MEKRIPFGGRYLDKEEEVFDYNAWDYVDLSPEMLAEAQLKIKVQAEGKCKDPELYDTEPALFWNNFYANNEGNFFKNRNWLSIEFPELFQFKEKYDESSRFTLLEVGCGAGNTVFPFLQTAKSQDRTNIFAYACDYSSNAVRVVKSHEFYDEKVIKALVYDLTCPDLPEGVDEGSVDIITCIFVLSAIHPRDWRQAASNMYKLLKPGGLILFRDYGRYDLAQVRMKQDRLLDQDNFYRRGDGTRVYFFTLEDLAEIFKDFEVVQNASDKRLLVNRKRKLKMFRCWQQGKYRKPR